MEVILIFKITQKCDLQDQDCAHLWTSATKKLFIFAIRTCFFSLRSRYRKLKREIVMNVGLLDIKALCYEKYAKILVDRHCNIFFFFSIITQSYFLQNIMHFMIKYLVLCCSPLIIIFIFQFSVFSTQCKKQVWIAKITSSLSASIVKTNN